MTDARPSNPAPPAQKIATIGWFEALDWRYLRAPSVVALIAANVIPLVGVLYWGWNLYGLMLLYWLETGIIGFFVLLQMALTERRAAFVLVPFFTLHFGVFMAVHLLFLTALFASNSGYFGSMREIVLAAFSETGMWLAVFGLVSSHGFSFVVNVFIPLQRQNAGEAGQGTPRNSMTGVYGRVVVLHVTILIGGFLISTLKSAVPAFILLIVLKTVVDIAAHVRKNFRPAM